MLRHHLVVMFRKVKRLKGTFLINIVGLSTGLASFLLIYLWVNFEWNFDKFHENGENTYQVMERHELSNGVSVKTTTAGLAAQTLREEYPEVEYAVSVTSSSWFPKFILEKQGDQKFKAVGQFVGPDFFKVFSFGFFQGDINTALIGKNNIVMSESLAVKMFGTTDHVVGKTIDMQLPPLKSRQVLITGLFKDVPDNSSENFDFVLPMEFFIELSPAVLDWGNDGTNAYVTLKAGTDVEDFNRKVKNLISTKSDDANRTTFLRNYAEGYLYGKYENGKKAGGRIEYVKLFSAVALFIILIACTNFMNLSTARASDRAKEVGVKKSLGARRDILTVQFLGESVLLAFLALFIAIFLVSMILPYFNEIMGRQLRFSFSAEEIMVLLGVTLLTGLLSGIYPALHLSGLQTSAVLKGKVQSSQWVLAMRQGLVVFQFVLSIIFIVAILVVYSQVQYINNKDLGYEGEGVVYFEKEGRLNQDINSFLLEVRQIPGVINASSMWGSLTGGYSTTGNVQWEGKRSSDDVGFEVMGVDYDLIETLQLKIKTGKFFSREFGADNSKVIFNEKAIEIMGLEDPLGKTVRVEGSPLEIIGVVEDFHFQSLHESIKPVLMRLQPERNSLVMIKVTPGNEKKVIASLDGLYKNWNPGYPLEVRFLDEEYQKLYTAENQLGVLVRYFAGLAIIISCLGLYGLTRFNVERRSKEIGVRKVLGANSLNIARLLSKDFQNLLLISAVLAIPISYFLAQNWLQNFTYAIKLGWWHFLLAIGLTIVVTLLAISLQLVKAANINPVESLRSND